MPAKSPPFLTVRSNTVTIAQALSAVGNVESEQEAENEPVNRACKAYGERRAAAGWQRRSTNEHCWHKETADCGDKDTAL
jgi:hypothetical protein